MFGVQPPDPYDKAYTYQEPDAGQLSKLTFFLYGTGWKAYIVRTGNGEEFLCWSKSREDVEAVWGEGSVRESSRITFRPNHVVMFPEEDGGRIKSKSKVGQ